MRVLGFTQSLLTHLNMGKEETMCEWKIGPVNPKITEDTDFDDLSSNLVCALICSDHGTFEVAAENQVCPVCEQNAWEKKAQDMEDEFFAQMERRCYDREVNRD
jgi:hypothetical protein